MADEQVIPEADQTAVRVALWRALHLEVDGQPPVLTDPVGLRLADPADGWRERPDMDPEFTRGFRAAIVARARFIEDLVTTAVDAGVGQYVLLGAGLEMLALARAADFTDARHVSAAELNGRYFAGRQDRLRMSAGEDLLVATV